MKSTFRSRVASLAMLALLGISLTGCKEKLQNLTARVTAKEAPEKETVTVTLVEEDVLEVRPAEPLPPEPENVPEPEKVIDRSAVVSILGYHDFTKNKVKRKQSMKINVEDFRQQMQALKDNEIPVISMSDFLAWKREEINIPKTSVVITIDDGWKEVHTYALGVLKEFEYPFTLYLYTKYVNVGGRSLTDEQVREIIAGGGEIGCHSHSHTNMSSAKRRGAEAYKVYLQKEMVDAKKWLEDRYDIEITSFAYPFGAYNQEVVEFGREVGYEAMVTVNGKKTVWDSEMMELGRYIVHGENPVNFMLGTSFRGSGGMVSGNNLLAAQKGEDGEPDEPPLVVTYPANKEIIDVRRPVIELDLSRLEGIDPESIVMKVSGLGSVPAEYDADSGKLSYQPRQKIRTDECNVRVTLQRKGEKKPDIIAWQFSINRLADYLSSLSTEENG